MEASVRTRQPYALIKMQYSNAWMLQSIYRNSLL